MTIPADMTMLQTLADAAREAYDSVLVSGKAPLDAVTKVAAEHRFTEPWTERLCELTNRLLAMDHMTNSPPEKRASDHPLVKTEDVVARLFPATIGPMSKAASTPAAPTPGEIFRPGASMEKAASAAAEPAQPAAPFGGGSFIGALDGLRKYRTKMAHADELYRDDKVRIETDVRLAMAKAAATIEQYALSFQDVEERAIHRLGPDARSAMDMIAPFMHTKVARFTGEPRIFTTNPWEGSPWKEVDQAVEQMCKSALDYMGATWVHKMAMSIVRKLDAGLKDVAQTTAKRAGFSESLMEAGKGALGADPNKGPSFDSVITAGLAPEDVQSLRIVNARQALAEAMSDPIIKSFPLHRRLQEFNRIGEVSPRASTSASTLIPLLREALANQDVSPFALKQRQEVESSLAQSQDPMVSK
jgi:hypothetical protein